MKKLQLIILTIVAILVLVMASTLVSPILIVCEDMGEDGSIDMAATFSVAGFEWIYPGSSFNSEGQTLHNVHIDNPQDPYGAARDIMSYTYHFTPHIVVSLSSEGAEAIFGGNIVDDIRANDAYNGYEGNENVPGTMSRGDAIDTAMGQNIPNLLQVPVQILLGKITFHFV
ncbi:MAG: hypothetical protein E7Z79_06905 [Methanobrevibacter thaueri]|uniref:Uncharacterized protein n=1 Tax=Methanobrevibacter thaueri TaxID=190975 RepID=A0A8T3VDZ4_9EURY|nr:hypothetical protein [Methanobrevibacter thaueri]MBE6502157.1 hypothetical protein [Methanobrevibacter thaueri]